jgi:hypothetical protein
MSGYTNVSKVVVSNFTRLRAFMNRGFSKQVVYLYQVVLTISLLFLALLLVTNAVHAQSEQLPTSDNRLKFDLVGITGSMAQDQLVAQLISNTVPTTITLDLYGVSDQGGAASIISDRVALPGKLLQSVTLAAGFTGPVRFAQPVVGTYLEAERTGDGIATLLLSWTPNTSAQPGEGHLLFEDSVGTVNGNVSFIDRLTPALLGVETPALVVEASVVTPGQSQNSADELEAVDTPGLILVIEDPRAIRYALFLSLVNR